MRTLAAIFLFGTLLGAVAVRADTAPAVSRDDVLKAITVFLATPSTREGDAAAATILAFAKTSDAIKISLSHAVVPWMKDGDVSDADTRGMLLSAYLAGNVGSQLKSGTAHDDIYAGWQQVLVTYKQLLTINPAAKIAEVEVLKSKEAGGQLQAYAEEVGGK